MASGQKGQDPAVVQRLQELEKERHDIIMKMQELEQQRSEHRLVIQAFENVEPTRRCFRMIGGVLVERTVAEIRPQIEDSINQIGNAIHTLEKQQEKASGELLKVKQQLGIAQEVRAAPASSEGKAATAAADASG
ncbi:unnamed protein product [Vitrella brassicaformis CCMP3155]|uniref:Prefoldin subunit 2 n=1 Tax=Vitrella brassicaformis (strain CCMP3155) TaxID=1169540 RepID=A0A0G4GBG6_VITBC|nr:unnamed protein product [Vitrella brassicaformis CCMP3155]|mmetsp:Transcript_13373/g.31923  ORF Transcript_13373/g.31923 Transcript_13373/m.31923 type:complete len:135 (-) Transcript_13373:123-527(-)|eukprot:CEM26462.1 unnamed protein product [Vitrella brassicaformis CCMP3155]